MMIESEGTYDKLGGPGDSFNLGDRSEHKVNTSQNFNTSRASAQKKFTEFKSQRSLLNFESKLDKDL